MKFLKVEILMSGILLFSTIGAIAQRVILNEDFERERRRDSVDINREPRLFIVDPYLPGKKGPYNLFSDSNSAFGNPPHANNICFDSAGKHGLYTSILLYDHGFPAGREILAIKLDTLLTRGSLYHMNMDLLFHKFAEYRVDSIQILFLNEEKDINAWLADKSFSGQYVPLGLTDIDNLYWKNITCNFLAESEFGVVLIGNLKRDEDCRAIKVNNCNCCPKPKNSHWKYSELLIDNILITEVVK